SPASQWTGRWYATVRSTFPVHVHSEWSSVGSACAAAAAGPAAAFELSRMLHSRVLHGRMRRERAGSGQLHEVREFIILRLPNRRKSTARRAQIPAKPQRQQQSRTAPED